MNNPRDGKEEMTQLLVTGIRVGFIAAAIAAILSMITFAQTTRPTIESTPTATMEEVTNDSLKHGKKSTGQDTSVQTNPPVGSAISAVDNIEIQHRFNELRRELLDDRAAYINRWLDVIAIVLAFFGIVVVLGSYIGFKRFQEIKTEAKGYVEEIKKNRDISAEIIQTLNAETVADKPEEAEQTVANIRENPGASPIDRAVARAVSLQQENKKDEAIEKWRAVAHIAEENDNNQAARAWFSVGYLLENPEDNILAYDRAISLKPDFANAYYNRGVVKGELGQRDEAIADYDEAIGLKPDFVEAYNNRGNAKVALGQHDEAIADYDEAIRLKPDYADAYNNRGVVKGKLGQSEDAIADYNEAIRLKPDFADAYYNRGDARSALGQRAEAIADYDEAIRLKPDFIETYNNRGIEKVELGQIADAIADYDEAIRLKPDFAESYNNRGTAKGKLGQGEDAIADYNEAIRLKPDYAEAYNNRGKVKGALGKYADAIADFDEGICLQPDDATAYYSRGLAKRELGQISEARQDFENARDLAREASNDSIADAAEQLLRELDAAGT